MNRNDDARHALGRVLRRLREARGYTQEGLSALAGVDRTYVGHVERGARNVSFENLWQLAVALGLSWRALGDALDAEEAFHRAPNAPRPSQSPPRRRLRGRPRADEHTENGL